ncbi:MAG: hypothetical protein ABF888_10525, partial [Acetobacter papayae]
MSAFHTAVDERKGQHATPGGRVVRGLRPGIVLLLIAAVFVGLLHIFAVMGLMYGMRGSSLPPQHHAPIETRILPPPPP